VVSLSNRSSFDRLRTSERIQDVVSQPLVVSLSNHGEGERTGVWPRAWPSVWPRRF